MKRMNSGLLLAALSLALLGVTGCANLQPPAPPPAPAPAPAPAPEEVHASVQFGGVMVSIYHPDTHIMYMWYGDPRPNNKRPLSCIKLQMSADPNTPPKSLACH